MPQCNFHGTFLFLLTPETPLDAIYYPTCMARTRNVSEICFSMPLLKDGGRTDKPGKLWVLRQDDFHVLNIYIYHSLASCIMCCLTLKLVEKNFKNDIVTAVEQSVSEAGGGAGGDVWASESARCQEEAM